MLRDRLVCGCKDHRLQCKLLTEADLSFDKAFKIAKAMEAAEKEAKGLQDVPGAPVNRLAEGYPSGNNRPGPATILPISHRKVY